MQRSRFKPVVCIFVRPLAVGRFTLTDFFDNNRYSHDPRSQFMGWGVMCNGVRDYAADVLATFGLSVDGKRWHRPEDTIASEIIVTTEVRCGPGRCGYIMNRV